MLSRYKLVYLAKNRSTRINSEYRGGGGGEIICSEGHQRPLMENW